MGVTWQRPVEWRMDLPDLDGRAVLGLLFESKAGPLEYIRGVARSNGGGLSVVAEGGQLYRVPASFAVLAQPVSDGVRVAAPAALQVLLSGVEFLVPIPPPEGANIALAVAPGWHNPPAT